MDMTSDGTRSRLKALRDGLLALHKYLMDSERALYERDVERIETRGQYLQLVLNDPWFAWLHELSKFIVKVDEALDARDGLSDEYGAKLIVEAHALVSPSEEGSGFARKYFDIMQRDPGAVLAHRDMMRIFSEIGAVSPA
jgi:hypothetical protein